MNEDLNRVIQVDLEKEMKESYLAYSMSVIVSRALPDVRDGLKPVHRRILYTMYENGLSPDKAYRKSADTVGSVLGRYHPHGDASVYDAMVRLAQDFSMRYPLVDGHGNFGSVDGDPAAAYRYTEARMSKIAMSMLTDIDKDTVDFMPNYDDHLQEPVMLPSRFPNLLVNGSTGIAVGMSTNIPPHNLGEVVDAVCCMIDNPDATLDELMAYLKGPDFPTGGIIMGRSGIRAAYATGRGKITLRAKAEIEEHKNRLRIIVTEIPYMVNKARLIESIAGLVKEKRIDGISDLRDESDRDGMRIVIELKRDANAQVVLNRLYTFSQLQETVGVIMLAIDGKQPRVMTLREILRSYLDFQFQVITRRTRYELKKAKEREHILEGLKIALDYIDEVIKIIRASKDQPSSKAALIERFGLSDAQAAAIVAMRLGQLSGLERAKIEDELEAILAKVADLEDILSHDSRVYAIVREELVSLKAKFGDERRTEIQTVSGEVDIEDLIPVEECVVTLTHFGYVKRQPADAYKTQKRGGRGISGMNRREEDMVEDLFVCSSHDHICFFTNRGRLFRLKCYEIPESSRTGRGTNIVNLLPLDQEERVSAMLKVSDFTDDRFLVMVTKKGVIKRTELSAYRNIRKSGLIAIHLDEDDELAWVRETSGNSELLIATRNGMAIRFQETDARPLGRTARGVKSIQLEDNDEVVGMARVKEGAMLMTVTEKGSGRRTSFDQYRLQSRGGKGIRNYKVSEEKGFVAAVKAVTPDDDVIMITDGGIIIRINSDDVTQQSRYGSGVRVMRVPEGGRIVTLARVPKEESGESEDLLPDGEENGNPGAGIVREPSGLEEKMARAVQDFADFALEQQKREDPAKEEE